MGKIFKVSLLVLFPLLFFLLPPLLRNSQVVYAATCTTSSNTVVIGDAITIRTDDLTDGTHPIRLSTYGGDPINLGNINNSVPGGEHIGTFTIPQNAEPIEYQIQFDLTGSGAWEACTSGNIQITDSSSSTSDSSTGNLASGSPAQIRDMVVVIGNIIKLLAPFAAIAFLAMMLYGGFQLIISGGDPKAAAGARNTFTYAILGLILVVVVWLLLLLIKNLTDVDITTVSIP